MSTSTKRSSYAVDVRVEDDALYISLSDGRAITAPLSWFPRLESAAEHERNDWRLIGAGEGIHWEAIDEDVSVATLLRGAP